MRNYRERSDTVRRVFLTALCYLATLSSLTSAKTTVTQKIGFAGGLRSDENSRERSPVFAATSSTNYHPTDFHSYEDHRGHPNRHSHEDFRSDDKQLGRIQYNKLPAYGPRSQPEYDNPRKYTNSVSPYKKLYALAPSPPPSPFPSQDYNSIDRNHDNHDTPQPEPKKYAFAYAVRDGYRGDDFSHKESRDGKVTMGEYKVLLPDGRLQVVRYTADALAGFKADVTYEGEDTPPHLKPNSTPKPYTSSPSKSPYFGQPSSAVHKKYVSPPPPPPSRSDPPIYVSNLPRSRPSLSPSVIYADQDHHDDHYVIHRSIPGHSDYSHSPNSIQASPSPSPHPIIYNLSPTPYTFKKQLSAPSPTYSAFHKHPINIGPTTATYYGPSVTPKNIYEKILASPSPSSLGPTKEPYSAIPRGYRAGPSPTPYNKVPLYKVIPSPSPAVEGHRKILNLVSSPSPGLESHRKIINVVSSPSPGEPYTRKSRLIPVELFKAGPIKDVYNPHRQGPLISADYQSNPHGQPQHYIIEHDDHHVDEHHHYPRHSAQDYGHGHGIAPIKSSLATFIDKANFGHGTPKPSLYIKTKPLIGVGRPIRPSVGGLVYLETPGQGPRPNSLGVKEFMDRIPHGNLPLQKTTTHPYEIGSKDYGADVSYGNSNSSPNSKSSFIPSQQIPEEYLPRLETDKFRHHSREYLTNDKEDSIVTYKDDQLGPPEY